MEQFIRTKMLVGEEGLNFLQKSKVMIFGVGGVGSYTVEALARVGIGSLVLVDFDKIEVSNINRQLPALHSTIGRYKVDVLKERIKDINPQADVVIYKRKVCSENAEVFFGENATYVVDAIDMISGKIAIIETACRSKTPIISALGAGNRINPLQLKIGDIHETAGSGCPLARIMRRELKKRGITRGLQVIYSAERPHKNIAFLGSKVLGSISFVPSVVGFYLAAQVVTNLLNRFSVAND